MIGRVRNVFDLARRSLEPGDLVFGDADRALEIAGRETSGNETTRARWCSPDSIDS